MKILVDADSFPSSAKNLLQKKAIRLNIPLLYFANRNIPFTLTSKLFTMVLCRQESGAADNAILEKANIGDLVVTRDIPLAARLIEKNIRVINDRGLCFSKENIAELLKERDLSMQMAALGIQTGGKKKKSYGQKELTAFSQCLDKIIQQE